jgi:hypothetical protein
MLILRESVEKYFNLKFFFKKSQDLLKKSKGLTNLFWINHHKHK